MRTDEVFYAATKFLAASVTGGKGTGLHKSPELVADCVDLAEQLVTEIEKREKAAKLDLAPPVAPDGDPAAPPKK